MKPLHYVLTCTRRYRGCQIKFLIDLQEVQWIRRIRILKKPGVTTPAFFLNHGLFFMCWVPRHRGQKKCQEVVALNIYAFDWNLFWIWQAGEDENKIRYRANKLWLRIGGWCYSPNSGISLARMIFTTLFFGVGPMVSPTNSTGTFVKSMVFRSMMA